MKKTTTIIKHTIGGLLAAGLLAVWLVDVYQSAVEIGGAGNALWLTPILAVLWLAIVIGTISLLEWLFK